VRAGQIGLWHITLVDIARLNGLDPEACLRNVIGRIAGHPINWINDLLPWTTAFQARIPVAA